MAKYYAVRVGKTPGIYLTWPDCQAQVKGYSGAVYKSFSTEEEAKRFIKIEPTVEVDEAALIAYVDGSFNLSKGLYGYGCVLIFNQQVIKELYGSGDEEEYVSMRNVSGEILGSEMAIEYAIANKYPSVCIYYDYEGIQKWADGLWKTNKIGTQRYQQYIKEKREQINIHFVKVLAHSGDFYNERADYLAKKSVGIVDEN